MASILKAAGVGTSPEVYAAYAMVKAGVILLGVIPCLFLLPLLSPVLVLLAVNLYGKWGVTDRSNFDRLGLADYPILSDLYGLIDGLKKGGFQW